MPRRRPFVPGTGPARTREPGSRRRSGWRRCRRRGPGSDQWSADRLPRTRGASERQAGGRGRERPEAACPVGRARWPLVRWHSRTLELIAARLRCSMLTQQILIDFGRRPRVGRSTLREAIGQDNPSVGGVVRFPVHLGRLGRSVRQGTLAPGSWYNRLDRTIPHHAGLRVMSRQSRHGLTSPVRDRQTQGSDDDRAMRPPSTSIPDWRLPA